MKWLVTWLFVLFVIFQSSMLSAQVVVNSAEEIRAALIEPHNRVVIEEGTYYFEKPLIIKGSNREIVGRGIPTLHFSVPNEFGIFFQNTGNERIVIKGLRIVGAGVGIIGAGSETVVKDCFVEESAQQGINLQGNRLIISGNHVRNVAGLGIVLGGDVADAIVSNNVVDGCAVGIQWGYSGSGVIISNNSISNCLSGVSVGGMDVDGQMFTGRCAISGNVIRHVEKGIDIKRKDAADEAHVVSDFLVFDNMISDVRGAGIRLQNAQDVTLQGNVVEETFYGIRVEEGCSNTEIVGNRIRDAMIQCVVVESDDTLIAGNRISKCGYDGIYLVAGNNFLSVTIQGNFFSGIGRDCVRNRK
jgi:parallel beta-helix repeat protein